MCVLFYRPYFWTKKTKRLFTPWKLGSVKKLITFMQSVGGTHFLNITPLLISSGCFAASSALDPKIVIVPLTSMCASL